MNLDQKAAAALKLPPNKTDHFAWDDTLGGFGVRVRAGGSRTWTVQYDIAGRTRRVSLGPVTTIDASTARRRAKELLAMVRLGRDPAGEKATARAQAAETVGAALKDYLAHRRPAMRPRSYVETERHLLKHCRTLHPLPLAKVDRRAVATRISSIAVKSGPVTANRVRASLSAFFAWCVREGRADSNPVIGTTTYDEASRDRVLAPHELKAIWQATGGPDDYSAAIRLLMLTGCRISEIGGLRWSENRDDRIELPPERTKNGVRHVIPLTEPMRRILDARPRKPGRDFIFGRCEGRPFNGWAKGKLQLDARIGEAISTRWTTHDLRRSFVTHLIELGTPPHVVEALVNHTSGSKGGVAGIYDRSKLEGPKRQALERWAAHIEALVAGREDNVVTLRP